MAAASPKPPWCPWLAGADLLCLGAERTQGSVREVQAAVVAAVRSGRLPEERLVDAAHRITGCWDRPRPAGAVRLSTWPRR